MKKFAFFLPQFHEIEENNLWWGKGFTEWVNVKNAKPFFKNHLQPKKPIDGYYNLLEKSTVELQTKLMNEHNVDGLIYYHYYFTGKKLLEKPAENLLKWKDINQKFFFCWANHSWIRSWNGTKEILLEQTYGTKNDWLAHFNYLLPFFKDERYEKKDNRPLFMIFNSIFDEKTEMLEFFDKKCKENGFDGIYIIDSCFDIKDYEENCKIEESYEKLIFLREPNFAIHSYKKFSIRLINKIKRVLNSILKQKKFIIKYNGNKLVKNSQKKMVKGNNIIHGLFFEWDNTPRHKNRGYIISPIDKKTFLEYMNKIKDEEYVFINAWNEWAEGMILEGTEENEYKYLEWIKELK